MRRLLPLVLTGALFVGCGAHAEESIPQELNVDANSVTLPEAKEAIPVFELTLKDPVTAKEEASLRRIGGVEVVTQLSSKKIAVEGPKATERLEVAAVEPIVFRSVAPPTTRVADFVWVSLVMGRAAPTFDAASKLGMEDGASLTIGSVPFDVGAVADNGVPNFADVLVQNGAADELRLGPPRTLIVGAEAGASVDAIGRAIERRLPGAESRRLVESAEAPVHEEGAPTPMGRVSGGTIGSMTGSRRTSCTERSRSSATSPATASSSPGSSAPSMRSRRRGWGTSSIRPSTEAVTSLVSSTGIRTSRSRCTPSAWPWIST
jgi:hypothetical protein